jgi:membrane protein
MGIYDRSDRHHVFLFGGGLAFSLFTCIIPFLLIIFSLLGMILAASSVENQIHTFINTIIPYKAYADYAEKIIFSRIAEVVEYKSIAGYIGGFGLLFAASGLFSSMRTILNNIFGGSDTVHPVIGKLRDFIMVIMVILFLLLSMIILPAIDVIKNITYRFEVFNYLVLSSFEHAAISLVSYFTIFFLFYIFYTFIPYAKLGRKVPMISAFWAATLWEIAKRLFGYYINHLATLTKIYGTYTLIVVLAFWIYYTSVIFIIGAEIGQLYRERLKTAKLKN